MIHCESGKVICTVSDSDMDALEDLGLLSFTKMMYEDDVDKAVNTVRKSIFTADLSTIYVALLEVMGIEQGLQIISKSVETIQRKVEEGEI